jgi:hypothetical protein
MDMKRLASRMAQEQPETDVNVDDFLQPQTEYSCHVELSITAEFEGSVSKEELLTKLKSELTAALKKSMIITSKDFDLKPTGVNVRELKFDCAVNNVEGDELLE